MNHSIVAQKAPKAGKYMQTRVKRRCLGCVLYSLMHRYARSAYRGSASDASADLPGVRTCLHDFLLLSAPLIFIFIFIFIFLSFYFSISIYFFIFFIFFLRSVSSSLRSSHALHLTAYREKNCARYSDGIIPVILLNTFAK